MKYHSRACNAYTSLTLHCSHHACWKSSPIVWNHLKIQLPHCPFVHIYILEWLKQILRKGCGDIQNFISTSPPPLLVQETGLHTIILYSNVSSLSILQKRSLVYSMTRTPVDQCEVMRPSTYINASCLNAWRLLFQIMFLKCHSRFADTNTA